MSITTVVRSVRRDNTWDIVYRCLCSVLYLSLENYGVLVLNYRRSFCVMRGHDVYGVKYCNLQTYARKVGLL